MRTDSEGVGRHGCGEGFEGEAGFIDEVELSPGSAADWMAGGAVPWFRTVFDATVEATGSDVGESDGSGTGTTNAPGGEGFAELVLCLRWDWEVHAEGEFFVHEGGGRRYGVASLDGSEVRPTLQEQVTAVVVDKAVDGHAFAKDTEGNAAFGYADGVVVGTVYGIENPSEFVGEVAEFGGVLAFLGAKVVFGEGCGEGGEELAGDGFIHHGYSCPVFLPSAFGLAEVFSEIAHLAEHGFLSCEYAAPQGFVGVREVERVLELV